jgi:hypothetical protein
MNNNELSLSSLIKHESPHRWSLHQLL